MNAVKQSGGLRERLFNAAYNAKKQAMLNGEETLIFHFSTYNINLILFAKKAWLTIMICCEIEISNEEIPFPIEYILSIIINIANF